MIAFLLGFSAAPALTYLVARGLGAVLGPARFRFPLYWSAGAAAGASSSGLRGDWLYMSGGLTSAAAALVVLWWRTRRGREGLP